MNDTALKEAEEIIKNPTHPRFQHHITTLLSRCDNSKEVFSILPRRIFIDSWPKIKSYWSKLGHARDFMLWWDSIYTQLLKSKNKSAENIGMEIKSGILKKLGDTIRTARIKKGWSQSELSKRAGIHQPDISSIEQGKLNITMFTFLKLCKILSISEISLK